MRKQGPSYFFDTVTLSNFALAGHFELLIARYGRRALMTPEVLDEVTDGVVAGYYGLSVIEDAVDEGRIGRATPLPAPARQTYRELLRILAPGEASCIAHAAALNGVVVTDDRTARQCCSERSIVVTGSIGVLTACCIDGTLSPEDGDALLHDMIEAGYYSPVANISDLID